MADSPTGPSKVFISYSHRDIRYLDRLQEHLKPHIRAGTISLWVDTQLKPGEQWKAEIEQALISAQVAILLVSASFLASDFVTEVELPRLLAAAKERGVHILPVILTPCGFEFTELRHFQGVNDPAKPLSGLSQHGRDKVWVKLVRAVLEALEKPLKQHLLTELPLEDNPQPHQNLEVLVHLQDIVKRWDQIKRACKINSNKLAALLNETLPVALIGADALEVVLRAGFEFHYSKLSEPESHHIVEQAVRDVTGMPYRVHLIKRDEPIPATGYIWTLES